MIPEIIDFIPAWFIVLVWLVTNIGFVIYTNHKCHEGGITYQSTCRVFLAFCIIIITSILFGMKYMREEWKEDIVRINNEIEERLKSVDKVNTEVVEKENERVVVRTQQKVKVLTKVEQIKSDEMKDYYEALNEAARRPE